MKPNRIISIDILRGFALLGILLMNIMSFALPEIAYSNPEAYGGNGIHRVAYAITHIVADQKFMALFSMLFGASVMLLINKLQAKGSPIAWTHYKRNGWLLVFGLLHSVLLWDGDILTIYAICAFILYFFRNLAPRWQLTLGLIIFTLPSLFNIYAQLQYRSLDAASQSTISTYWNISDAELEDQLMFYRGDYASQLLYRSELATVESGSEANEGEALLSVSIYDDYFARALAMMLIGMALYTWGVISGKQSVQFYRRMLQIGLGVGYPLALLGLLANEANGWDVPYAVFIGRIPNNLATPFIASGYIALIMLWGQTALWKGLQDRLAAVGRMALSNYILQSLIGTTIFYGFGFGLFGRLNRAPLLLVVFAIWGIQLLVSPIWLRHFRFGPLEWIWRVLTYGQRQPLRKRAVYHL